MEISNVNGVQLPSSPEDLLQEIEELGQTVTRWNREPELEGRYMLLQSVRSLLERGAYQLSDFTSLPAEDISTLSQSESHIQGIDHTLERQGSTSVANVIRGRLASLLQKHGKKVEAERKEFVLKPGEFLLPPGEF